jgi:hypothetical protein
LCADSRPDVSETCPPPPFAGVGRDVRVSLIRFARTAAVLSAVTARLKSVRKGDRRSEQTRQAVSVVKGAMFSLIPLAKRAKIS